MMKGKGLFVLFFLGFFLFLSAQEDLDSLPNDQDGPRSEVKDQIVSFQELAWSYRDARPDSSLFYANKAYRLSKEIGFKHLEIQSLNYIGVAYRNLSNYSKAFEKYLEALKLAEEENDIEQRGYSLINLGNLYLYQTNYQGAITYFIQALDQAQALANKRMTAYCYLNLGRSYKGTREYGQAELYFKQAIEIRKELKDVAGGLAAEIDLAEVYMLMNEYKRSLAYHQDLIERIQKTDNPRLLTVAYNNLSKIYLVQGQIDKASENAFRAIEIAEKVSSRYDLKNILENLSHIYHSSGDYDRAFDYHVKYAELNQQLFSEENIRTIEQLKNQYKIEQQEAENDFLKKQSELNELVINRQRIIITLSVLAVLLLLFVAIIYIRSFQREKRLSREIKLQKDRIESDKNLIEKQSFKLKELDAAKSRFFANVSHDLRTPLSLIMGNIQLVRDDNDLFFTKEAEKNLDIALKNCKRLLYLTDEINDLTRLEEGRLNLQLENVRLGSYLSMLTEMFRGTAEFKGINLIFTNGLKADDTIAVDPRQFEKIIYNLVTNAIQHTSSGGEITVHAYTSDSIICIDVVDTGDGIPSESIPFIFDRFYQSVNNEYRTREGLGIGLALVKELVELHGGEIAVDSTLGLGTSFKLSFERLSSTIGGVPTTKDYVVSKKHLYDEIDKDHEAGVGLPNTSDKPTILLVDDHPEIRHHIRQLIEEEFHLLEAAHGIEALDILDKYEIDLIISDLMMPFMDGFELIESLKSHDKFSKVPILIISARISDSDQEKVLKRGVNEYLQKPFQKDEFLQRIQNLLLQKANWDSASEGSFETVFDKKNVGNYEKDILAKVEQLIMNRINDEKLTVYDMADVMAASERQVYRLIKRITGATPHEYITEIRMKYAEFLIRKGKVKNASEAAKSIGFNNVTVFNRQFEKKYGFKPTDLLKPQHD